MADIILTTLNARYIHASFGLRYLFANLEELQTCTKLVEFEISHEAKDIVEEILKHEPRIVGLGVYIWNTTKTQEVISILKRVRPQIIIVVGGPEVSHEVESQSIVALSDYVICGEGEHAFRDLCRFLLATNDLLPPSKIIHAKLPEVSEIKLPYDLYTEDDIANRVIYVEVSRGCPFTCEFCLSSIKLPVRQFNVDTVLAEIDKLFLKGLRTFKFVDRTFNLNLQTASQILEFFLRRMEPGLFVHFEMVPDRFPDKLRELVSCFPAGSLQFEVGIQTFNPEVGTLISRRQNYAKISDNLKFLRNETGVYIHADLIAGLPGEDIESFAAGFDTLVELDPHEIQVGILKRLKGTTIIRHDIEWEMRYSESTPFEILHTKTMHFETLQRIRRFSRFWDLISNSGNFKLTRSQIWKGESSAFWSFMQLTDWLFVKLQRQSGVSLKALTGLVFDYFIEVKKFNAKEIGDLLATDYCRGGRVDLPLQLKPYYEDKFVLNKTSPLKLKRQQRIVASQ